MGTTTHEYSAVNERRWERVLLVVTAFLLVVLLVVVTVLEIQVQSRNRDIRTVKHVVREAVSASNSAEAAANKVNDGIDKRSPARQREQAQIDTIAQQVDRLVKELDR